MAYDDIAWLPLCLGITVLGMIASWLAWRRRGVAAGLRGAAWSLLPLGIYLLGAARMLWDIGTAVSRWVSGFVLRPSVWAGVAILGLVIVLYLASGVLRRRAGTKGRSADDRPAAGEPAGKRLRRGRPAGKELVGKEPASKERAGKEQGGSAADPEMAEIEEILKRRGIG